MGDVLEIEVDGEPLDGGSPGGSGPPKWGAPVAVALAGVLALGLLVVVVVPALTGQRDSQPEAPGTGDPAAAAAAPGASKSDERLAAANAALAAWGEFAVTADLGRLDGAFHPEGPQYEALADEAPAIANAPPGPPSYAVALTDEQVTAVSADEADVVGTVSWHRPGERDQHYGWEIVLRRGPSGQWLLWTVRES